MDTPPSLSELLLGIFGIGGMLIYMTWPLTPAITLILTFVFFCRLHTLTSTILWTIAISVPFLSLLLLKYLADSKTPEWIFNLKFFQQSYSQAYFLAFWIVFAAVWGIALLMIYKLYVEERRVSGPGIWR
jgi:hypothetical protein